MQTSDCQWCRTQEEQLPHIAVLGSNGIVSSRMFSKVSMGAMAGSSTDLSDLSRRFRHRVFLCSFVLCHLLQRSQCSARCGEGSKQRCAPKSGEVVPPLLCSPLLCSPLLCSLRCLWATFHALCNFVQFCAGSGGSSPRRWRGATRVGGPEVMALATMENSRDPAAECGRKRGLRCGQEMTRISPVWTTMERSRTQTI